MLCNGFRSVASLKSKTSKLATKSVNRRRMYSSGAFRTAFKRSELQIQKTTNQSKLVPKEDLVFGKYFTDHMFEVDWDSTNGWGTPHILPYHALTLDPSASVFHYALECFEGMKAYKSKEGKTLMFRPDLNMKRMNSSARRIVLPEFDEKEFSECIKELVRVDNRFIPESRGYSLYLRPTLISTSASLGVHVSRAAKLFVICSPVGPYYKTGFKPVSLIAESRYARACLGGTGEYKLGANYAGTILPAYEADKQGYNQVLWLVDDKISEVGTMNLFVHWTNTKGETELVTAPLNGTILPGVTRRSILDLAHQWKEFKVEEKEVTMTELATAIKEGRVKEIFGAGTAAIVSPVERILYKGTDYHIPVNSETALSTRFANTILSIQYGEIKSEWSVEV